MECAIAPNHSVVVSILEDVLSLVHFTFAFGNTAAVVEAFSAAEPVSGFSMSMELEPLAAISKESDPRESTSNELEPFDAASMEMEPLATMDLK